MERVVEPLKDLVEPSEDPEGNVFAVKSRGEILMAGEDEKGPYAVTPCGKCGGEPQRLSVTDLSSFVKLQMCGRYLAFQAGRGGSEVEGIRRRFPLLADPAYQEVGLRSEETVGSLLEVHGFQPAQGLLEESTWPRWLEEVGKADRDRALYAREVEISGQVGAFSLKGRIDFVLLLWENEVPKVRVLELKASRRNRSHHYVQLALYASLVKANPPIWQGQPVEVDYLVVRVDPGTMAPEDPLRPPTREEKKLLEQAIQDVEDLLKKGGLVEEILSGRDPFQIPYTLNARCDACGYNTVCLREAAERHDLELLSLPGDVVRGLREAGFRDLQDLAGAQPGDARWDEALKRMENPLPPAHLINRAQARLAPLDPGFSRREGYYPVQALPDTGFGTLPPHEIKIKDKDKPLIRIYLVVEKDLVAERLNALVAHVTSGPEGLQLPEDPEVPLSLKDHRFVAKVREKKWSGDLKKDDAAEGGLIQDFFSDLVTQLKEMLEKEKEAPLHFYVWSQADIKNLVEAILRVGPKGGSLLEALWHLMGCREGLEQLIFSSLADEVRTRYALGYTSLSLLTVTSLPFFGKPFPWHNLDGANLDSVNSDRVNLKSLFHHWLFDFYHFEDGQHMEVRSRNYDAVPPVYWRFFWDRKKEFPKNLPPEVRDAVRGAAPFIPTYLQARSLALRWLEERVTLKNKHLRKSILRPEELPDFRLEARGVLRVARDFLRFEQRVRLSLWLADKTLPPALRVRNGTALLLTKLKRSDKNLYQAKIKADTQGFTLKDLEARFTLGPGDFVRVAPADDPEEPQKTGDILSQGFTAVVEELNWTEGRVTLNLVSSPLSEPYIPKSAHPNGEWSLATMDPSPADYVAKRVDEVLSDLLEGEGASAGQVLDRWFDLEHPKVPPVEEDSSLLERAKKVLKALDVLNESQKHAILEGFRHRVQVLQGPPGTGKTQTTAVAVLLWAQFLLADGETMGVAAATHTAVDTLLERVQALENKVREAFKSVEEEWRPLDYPRLEPKRKEEGEPCHEAEKKRKKKEEECKATPPRLLLLFGTTNGLLKAKCSLKLLVVDEASMMPFPHFLALASLLSREQGKEGRILLTGDHRQLAPVIQHQWEEEDRPGVQRYLPYLSAFEAMLRLREAMEAPQGVVAYSVLDHTHRLPQEVRLLIQPLYHRDGVELRGREAQKGMSLPENIWKAVWEGGEGVYLFVHGERRSRKRNPLEAEVILRILQAALQVDPQELQVDPQELAVVTPFRALRTLLRERLEERVGLVDTVERLQGGERRVIFYSASASDPDAITSLQEFLLDVNRTNVAFSRAKEKLVVVVAETLLSYVPPEQEAYEDAVLWKELRRLCTQEVGKEELEGCWVRLLVPPRGDA